MSNGLAIAKFLEKHPCVEKVIHPGLPSHPQHEVRYFMKNFNSRKKCKALFY